MDIAHLLIGLALIATGFLVKVEPNLIAGYSSMSKEAKKRVDIGGLSAFMSKGLITIGIAIILGYYFFKLVGLTTIADLTIVLVTMPGAVILVIGGQQYNAKNDSNSNAKTGIKTKLTYVLLALVVASVAGITIYGLIPSKAIFVDRHIHFTGAYGFDLDVSDIKSISLTEDIPTIMLRTNGFSLGAVNKGNFNLDELGRTRLLVHSEKSPFLVIVRGNSERIIVNYKDKSETEDLYHRIKLLIDDNTR